MRLGLRVRPCPRAWACRSIECSRVPLGLGLGLEIRMTLGQDRDGN